MTKMLCVKILLALELLGFKPTLHSSSLHEHQCRIWANAVSVEGSEDAKDDLIDSK